MINFEGFSSIPRLSRGMVVTEKIDGSNAQIYITEHGKVYAGSRHRYITIEDDNFGFAAWVKENEEQLFRELGPGRHFGEWWGHQIQRTYGVDTRHFSLFNTARWNADHLYLCSVVPVIYQGVFCTKIIDEILQALSNCGSLAKRGFMKPEGLVIYHESSGQYFKKTIDKNDGHKTKK